MKHFSSPFARLIAIALAIVLVGALHAHIVTAPSYAPVHLSRVLLLSVFIILLVLLAAQLFRMSVSFLASRESAPPLLREIRNYGVTGTLWNIYRRRAFHRVRLSTLFLTWGLIILGIVALLKATASLEESELLFLAERSPVLQGDTVSTVRAFSLVTGDNNPVDYLEDLSRIAEGLTASGARLVVARFPSLDQTPGRIAAARDSLERRGGVLFFTDIPPWFRQNLRYPALSSRGMVFPPISQCDVTSLLETYESRETLARWSPCLATGSGIHYIDVALVAAGRYLGYPDTLTPVCEAGQITYGSLSVPVTAGGQAISVRHLRLDRVFFNCSASRELDSDTLKFYYARDNGKDVRCSTTFPADYAPQVRDKIVFLDWHVSGDYSNWWGGGFGYADILESLLHDQVIRKCERLPLFLAAAVVLLSALLCLRVRLTMAMGLILGGAAILSLFSLWLLTAHLVLLNAAYPVLAAILSAVIFPLVRLSHENP